MSASPSRSSRWIAAAATSSFRAARSSKRPAPNSAPISSQRLEEGQVIDGVVKNITDYGAFVDFGGIDGLLHVTDIAWRRVNHPSESAERRRHGQGADHPYQPRDAAYFARHEAAAGRSVVGIEAKYPVGAKLKGRVTNITDYGAFVELEPGIEGLIHVSEMSWTKKNVHPGKIVSTSQEVEVQVLEVDPTKRRISLGLKQTQPTRGMLSLERTRRCTIEGEVKNKTEFGLFIGLDNGDVDGMVHLSDLDWSEARRAGDRGVQEGRHGEGHGARRRQSRRSASRSASSSSTGDPAEAADA
jgi:small subunit ribosomal protein S1